ncbi:MAG: hypothetical protein HEQ23_12325 [Tepidisphaera sp.]|jgi:hypothetical protein
MQPFLLASDAETIVPSVAILGGLLIAALAIISGTIRRISQTKEREQSRREIAAYVAEGSMNAEEAERLINAGPRPKKDD